MTSKFWLELSAYGKLPLSREFVGLNDREPGARAIKDFLHEGARHLAQLPAGPLESIRVYAPVDSGRTLAVASVWSSADEGGLRRFPFAFFSLCPIEQAPRLGVGFSSAFRVLHAVHERLFGEVAQLDSPHAFEQHLTTDDDASISVPVDPGAAAERFRERAETFPTGRWAAALYGTDAHRFLVALWRLRKVLAASGGSLASLATDRPGVRVPLARTHALEPQADAWLGLLLRHESRPFPPSILLGRFGPDGTASLCLFFRPLEPGDLAMLEGQPVRGLIDLSEDKEPADMDGFPEFCETIRQRVLGSHKTLAALPDILEES